MLPRNQIHRLQDREVFIPYLHIAEDCIFYARHRTVGTAVRPVVFVHGAGGSHLSWPPALRRLPYTMTYLLDLPGHGRSKGEGCKTIEAYAEVLRRFITLLELGEAVLIGHSMGGAIALACAVDAPHLCHRLVMINSAAKFTVPPTILEALETDKQRAIELITTHAFTPPPSSTWTDATRRLLGEVPLRTLRNDYLACQAFDAVERLHTVTVPTLIIGSIHDRLVPPDDARYLATKIPNARLAVLEHSGHMAVLTDTNIVREILDEFLLTGQNPAEGI